ncbi:hypothetical protein ScPMuIL_015394 [Solemya velum]
MTASTVSGSGQCTRGRCRRQHVKYRRPSQLLILIFAYITFVSFTLLLRSQNGTPNDKSSTTINSRTGRSRRSVANNGEITPELDDNGDDNCTERAIYQFPGNFMSLDDTQDGGVFIHILLVLYTFGALAILCDDYFVPSLEHICTDFGIHEDIAGATFMAIGSSAPELFTSIIGVFIAKSDVGVGTIVGSAVFNILFIIGLCGLSAGMVVKLTMWPLVRDCTFYLFSVIALILIIDDEQVHWYEGMSLVLMYAVYICVMYFNQKLETLFDKVVTKCCPRHYTKDTSNPEERQALLASSETGKYDSTGPADPKKSDVDQTADLMESNVDQTEKYEDDDYDSPWDIPQNFLLRIYWVAMIPVKAIAFVTIPDCRRPGWRKFYFLTFLGSIIWIAGFSYIMVWMVTIAGDALDIPDTVMGLTLIAAGTSVPDCLASLLVARDGYGDMAVSNCIGSNVFDILVCLGLPWLLDTAAIHSGEVIKISSSGLLYSAITLLSTIVFLLVAIHVVGWKLNKGLGATFLVVYVIVIGLSCLYELNIFGEFTLPPCPRH